MQLRAHKKYSKDYTPSNKSSKCSRKTQHLSHLQHLQVALSAALHVQKSGHKGVPAMFMEELDGLERLGWEKGQKGEKKSFCSYLHTSVAAENGCSRAKQVLSLPAVAESMARADSPYGKLRKSFEKKTSRDDSTASSSQNYSASCKEPSGKLRATQESITEKAESSCIKSTRPSALSQLSNRMVFYFCPAAIIGFIHVLLNAFLLFLTLYILSYFLYFMTVDVRYKISAKRQEAKSLMKEAERLYALNRCDPTTRVPALEKQCGEWETVARNGLSGIKYTRIAVEVVAETIDGFMSAFSWKSIALAALLALVMRILRR